MPFGINNVPWANLRGACYDPNESDPRPPASQPGGGSPNSPVPSLTFGSWWKNGHAPTYPIQFNLCRYDWASPLGFYNGGWGFNPTQSFPNSSAVSQYIAAVQDVLTQADNAGICIIVNGCFQPGNSDHDQYPSIVGISNFYANWYANTPYPGTEFTGNWWDVIWNNFSHPLIQILMTHPCVIGIKIDNEPGYGGGSPTNSILQTLGTYFAQKVRAMGCTIPIVYQCVGEKPSSVSDITDTVPNSAYGPYIFSIHYPDTAAGSLAQLTTMNMVQNTISSAQVPGCSTWYIDEATGTGGFTGNGYNAIWYWQACHNFGIPGPVMFIYRRNGGLLDSTVNMYPNAACLLASSNGLTYLSTPQYFTAVSNLGTHLVDGTPCALWALRNMAVPQTTNYQATLAQALDVETYHRGGTGFDQYMGQAVLSTEYAIFQQLKAKSPSWDRTAYTLPYLLNFSNFTSTPSQWQITTSTPATSTAANWNLMLKGYNMIPWFNLCDPVDNSSNVGGGYGNATNASILSFMTQTVPWFAHNPMYEVDLDDSNSGVNQNLVYPQTTSWPHFGAIIQRMPFVGGFFGLSNSTVNALIIGHTSGTGGPPGPDQCQELTAICNLSGADSFSSLPSLSGKDVVIGWPSTNDPSYTTDVQAIKTYVQNGGNLIVTGMRLIDMTDTTLQSLTGVGLGGTVSTGTVQVSQSHPILAPYASADIVANYGPYAGSTTVRNNNQPSTVTVILNDSNSGPLVWTNTVGSGKVVVIPDRYYNDNFLGDTGADQLSSGSAYFILNAILWLKGLPTPAISLPQFVYRTAWAKALSGGKGSFSGIILSLCGTKTGTKLLWFSNSTASPATIGMNFSTNYFGFGNNWIMIDQNTETLTSGAGDVTLNYVVPSTDWSPLYVQSTTPTPTNIAVSGSMGGRLRSVVSNNIVEAGSIAGAVAVTNITVTNPGVTINVYPIAGGQASAQAGKVSYIVPTPATGGSMTAGAPVITNAFAANTKMGGKMQALFKISQPVTGIIIGKLSAEDAKMTLSAKDATMKLSVIEPSMQVSYEEGA